MNRIILSRIHSLCLAVVVTALAACSSTVPNMKPLTESALADAERMWKAHGTNSYEIVVQLNPAKLSAMTYDVVVRDGKITGVKRDGQDVRPENTEDYSVLGLFGLLRQELRLTEKDANGMAKELADLFVRFDPETGRLDRYRRQTNRLAGSLRIEVLKYQPLPQT